MSNAHEVAQMYFDAWNNHDPEAIVTTFAEGGTYLDPTSGGELSGAAIGAYAAGLWAGFPDLSFEIVNEVDSGEGIVSAQWIMRGTNTAPFNGLPPSGKAVELPGADFIAVEDGKIRSVRGYFDSRGVPDQLGLQVLVQPAEVGPFKFGDSVSAQTGKTAAPGAFSVTTLHARDDGEVAQVRDYSRRITTELMEMPGFLGYVGLTIGHRMITVTAWEGPEDSRQLMKGGVHKEAVGKFFGPEIAAAGFTSVWTPDRINPMWVRCESCGQMSDSGKSGGTCKCGAALPEAPPYW